MLRQKLIICLVSLVHLATAQFSYNVNPYYSYTDTPANQYYSPGTFNYERPANQFHRRMFVPGLGMFRLINNLGPYSYFRNDQVNATRAIPSNEEYNSDALIKYNVLQYPTNYMNNRPTDKNDQENECKPVNNNNNLHEIQNSWNQNPIYTKSDKYKSVVSQTPYFILKSSDFPGKTFSSGSNTKPYMALNLHLFNDNPPKTETELRGSNSNVYPTDSLGKTDASSPFLLQSETQNYPLSSNTDEVPNPILYYYKVPCESEDSVNSLVYPYSTTEKDINGLYIPGPFLGSIISPYVSKHTQFKNNSDSFDNDVKTSDSTDTTNKNINSISKSSPYQAKILKPDVTSSKGLIMDTSHQPSYYPQVYQNLNSDEASSMTYLNHNKETTKNKFFQDSDSSLETLNPNFYSHTDSYSPVVASNVKVFPYLTQRASSLNNYWQNIDFDNNVPNTKSYCSVENPLNSNLPFSKGSNVNLSKEKLAYLIRPSSQFKRSKPTPDIISDYVQQELNGISNAFIPPFAQRYMSEYIENLNNANTAGGGYEKQRSNNERIGVNYEGQMSNNGGYGGNYDRYRSSNEWNGKFAYNNYNTDLGYNRK